MNWQILYSNKRVASSNTQARDEIRGDYMRDYDRVIFSSQFRKLQNKTQVFPLPGAVFVHNRLTHSLEVASVGRSLGKAVGDRLAKKYANEFSSNTSDFYRFELSDVIQTACLAHDIGNPPFGHFGEEAIRAFFSDFFSKSNVNDSLSENQKQDFIKFEGNANAFRILTTLFCNAGLKLTYTTLVSVVKYPSDSLSGFNKENLATKKSGFFDSEIHYFQELIEELGIIKTTELHNTYCRHPFVYLVEAADDICYRIIDLEDAFKLNIITYKEAEELLLPMFDEDESKEYINNKLKTISDESQKLSLLRAMLVNLLTRKCTDAFITNEDALLSGTLNMSLTDLIDKHLKDQLKKIDELSFQKIYNHKSVVEKELAGYHVIYGLLEEFVGALSHKHQSKSQKILTLLPTEFKISDNSSMYQNLSAIVDFVSGMTDNYAMELFRKLRGIQSPEFS